jgi:hypothetical protein
MSDDRSSEERNDKPRLKVTDRRKFTATGETRSSSTEGEDAPPAPPDTAAPAAAAGAAGADDAGKDARPPDAGTATGAPGPGGAAAAAASGRDSAAPPDGPGNGLPQRDIEDLPRDFTAFIEGMYLETMLYLGALPDPRTGEPAEDLGMAKYKIDLLGMLEEKTRGNLTDEEAGQLEEVLYQLRMFYVQTRQKAGGNS